MSTMRAIAKGVAAVAVAVGLTVGVAGVGNAAASSSHQVSKISDSGW